VVALAGTSPLGPSSLAESQNLLVLAVGKRALRRCPLTVVAV
jgi:hypothetical protein